MAPGPAQPPPPEQPHDAPPGEGAQAPPRDGGAPGQAPDDRYGPLSLERVVKDDGRALILYGHDESPAELGDTVARERAHGDSSA
jgi:hypothetical protein